MGLIIMADSQCRVCGCDDLHACPGGCAWVEDKIAGEGGPLCTACCGNAPDILWTMRKIDRATRRLRGKELDAYPVELAHVRKLARQLSVRLAHVAAS